MFRSIRWTLLVCYALILAAVITGFGATLYYKVHQSMMGKVDATLRAHAQALGGALKREGGRGYDLELSDEYVKYFGPEDGDPYYTIWEEDGRVLDLSRPDLEIPRPDAPGLRARGTRREVTMPHPGGALILVGQPVVAEREELRGLLKALIGVGAGVLVLALVSGWVLTSRALKPIDRISQAATAISSENLSQRIDTAETASELGRLAQTLNEAFDRLEKAFERQTRFTADASHELGTPLSVVISQAELALRKEREPAEYREALETVLKAAQRMKAVVEGLLTLARADATQVNLHREKVSLTKIVEETASMLGPLARETNVALVVSAEAVDVFGDRDRLREAVTNLVTNAIRYNRDGGTVDVTLRPEGAQAILTVADTGIGIPEQDQPHLFERFYRADRARARGPGGSGLGLAITKWTLEAHGGAISFTSREDGGTTFTVRLTRC